ncbi:phospholipase [Myxococcaceae bacterium JPH2]|nr:phospholipase [Myxococcaceae bacterium JPH2]
MKRSASWCVSGFLAAALVVLASGCHEEDSFVVNTAFGSSRLSARPAAPNALSTEKGVIWLTDTGTSGLVYVPESYQAGTPAPLVLLLHGAGELPESMLKRFRASADTAGALLLIPKSQEESWDMLIGKYGPDRDFIDDKLKQVFSRFSVDPARVGIGGFSDGATYALSLGLSNGDVFQHIAAFSAGFVAPSELVGKPRVYMSHGTRDPVLSFDTSGKYIEYQLTNEKYSVEFHAFDGKHELPADIAAEGFTFLVSDS